MTQFVRQLVFGTSEQIRDAKEDLTDSDFYDVQECRRQVDELLALDTPLKQVDWMKRKNMCVIGSNSSS